jgi:hypothetical protein
MMLQPLQVSRTKPHPRFSGLAFDYQQMEKIPLLGRAIVSPPLGAMAVALYLFGLGSRWGFALKRAHGDYRELRDISIRDILTFSVVLFALKPMVRATSKLIQKSIGIQLVQKAIKHPMPDKRFLGQLKNSPIGEFLLGKEEVFSHSSLEKIYTISSPNRLKTILLNHVSPRGVKKAIEEFSKTQNSEHQALLKEFQTHLEEAMKAKGVAVNPHVEQALNLVEKLETIGAKKIFTNYAQSNWAKPNLLSFLVVGGILGFGIPWFNIWFTKREYKKKMAQVVQAPLNLSKQPAKPIQVEQPSPAIVNNPPQNNFQVPANPFYPAQYAYAYPQTYTYPYTNAYYNAPYAASYTAPWQYTR